VINLKIAIISDTHIHKHAEKLEVLIKNRLSCADLIIHAGDYTDIRAVTLLQRSKKFLGVWGNNDKASIREITKEKEIIKVEKYKIGVYHGHGMRSTTIDNAYHAFSDDEVDIIIYGHSHQPSICTKKKVLMLNPGSPTNKRNERWFSYIILEICGDNIFASLHFY
jgi:uncharacterized protein